MELLKYSQYEYLLLMQDVKTGKLYDLTRLFMQIQYSTELMTGQAGKCVITLVEDPTEEIKDIPLGSSIQFSINDKGIFKGYVTRRGVNDSHIYQITALDSIFWLKNQVNLKTANKTASDIFKELTGPVYALLPGGQTINVYIITSSNVIVPPQIHEKKTIYAIIQDCMQYADVQENKRYMIRDNFGVLEFAELESLKTPYIIGDNNYLVGYAYEDSIEDSFNYIQTFRDNEDEGIRDLWIEFSSEAIGQWGKLLKLIEADKEATDQEIINLTKSELQYNNRIIETCKISALGKLGLYAGNGFFLDIPKINKNSMLWVLRATHTFGLDIHTMELEVYI
jgi:hypothetical protein